MGKLRNRDKALIGAGLILIIGLLISLGYLSGLTNKLFSSSKPVALTLSAQIDHGLDAHATPAMVHIQGADSSNQHVDCYQALLGGQDGTKTAQVNLPEMAEHPGIYTVAFISPINPDGSLYEVSEASSIDTNTAPQEVTMTSTMTYKAPESVTEEEFNTVLAQVQAGAQALGDKEIASALKQIQDKQSQMKNNKQVMEAALQEAKDNQMQVLTGTVKMVHSDDELYAALGVDNPYYGGINSPDNKRTYNSSAPKDNAVLVLDEPAELVGKLPKYHDESGEVPTQRTMRVSAVKLSYYPLFFSQFEGKKITILVKPERMLSLRTMIGCVPEKVVVQDEAFSVCEPISNLPVGEYEYLRSAGRTHGKWQIFDNGTMVDISYLLDTPGATNSDRYYYYSESEQERVTLDEKAPKKNGCQAYMIGKNGTFYYDSSKGILSREIEQQGRVVETVTYENWE